MNREEADALARKLLATDGTHNARVLIDGGSAMAETTPEVRAFYEQYFLKDEDKAMEQANNEETGITTNAILNNLISFMEQLAASGMEHKDIVSRGYDFALAKLRSKADVEMPQGREILATMLAQIMDHAADLLKAAVGRGIEVKPTKQRLFVEPFDKLPDGWDKGSISQSPNTRKFEDESRQLLSVKDLAQSFGDGMQELFSRGLVKPALVYPDGHPEQAEVYYALIPAVPANGDNQ